ncbi:hypothetical protein JCM15754A_15170 [Prevotella aurantiaca JCM 15754]|uniref:DUF3575 domain-containing protein n=1 Tax=Prevotella aurantiaca TaxID=596085 RepID=UPI00046942C0|nr:DUF3575 domain-containing protein [Prevotella aurantiaca]
MKRLFIAFLSVLAVITAHSQAISVNTDVAMLALQTYNIGAEMTIGNRSTLGLSVFTNNKPYWHTDMKMIGVQPEYRYYFGGRPMYHHFIGVNALAVDYDVKWKDTRYDGFAVGAGLTFGYVVSLSGHWTIDAHAGVGMVVFHQTKTTDGLPNLQTTSGGKTQDGYTGYEILPTKVGITLSYILR